ncbi:hypothetical protein EJB05_43257, partial [Eragrostis curvula]
MAFGATEEHLDGAACAGELIQDSTLPSRPAPSAAWPQTPHAPPLCWLRDEEGGKEIRITGFNYLGGSSGDMEPPMSLTIGSIDC